MPDEVSIPIGFSNELQRMRSPEAHTGDLRVSIPIGFSNELQRGTGVRHGVKIRPSFNPYRVFQ